MASFPDVRHDCEPSAPAEGVRAFRRLLAVAAALPASAGTAFALLELATPRGNRAVLSLDEVPA